MSQIYLNTQAAVIILAGDFNARIGDKYDYIKYVDSIETHTPIDNRVNSYCETFIDFLKDVSQ